MLNPNRPTALRRPAWRTPVGPAHTEKKIGEVELTTGGFARMTPEGWRKL